jgi:hypothetical protein
MASFRDWYTNPQNKVEENASTEESKFYDIVKVEIPSLKSFISWLILNKHITGNVKQRHTNVPVSLLALPVEKRILTLVKELPKIKELADEFNFKFGNFQGNADKKEIDKDKKTQQK